MGLSIAISGAIILSVLMIVLMTITGFVGNMFTIGDTSIQVSKLENIIDKTDISLDALEASIGSPNVNFTLNNDDIEKLWNFEHFNVFIEYENATNTFVEELSFNGDCSGIAPSAGNWCIETIGADILDEGIINEGESADIFTRVSLPLQSANAFVTVSTDNGVVAKLPAPKRSWIDAAPIPPITCEVGNYGRTFIDTDTGLSYVCDPTRDKWLSIETTALYGENGGPCANTNDIGNDQDCAVTFGNNVGGQTTPPTLGLYVPYNMTVIGWGFSSADDTCGTTWDLEVWGSGSDSADSPLSLVNGGEVATGLDGSPQTADDADVDIDGDQHVLWGVDNNCGGGSIIDWNAILYVKWRHDQP